MNTPTTTSPSPTLGHRSTPVDGFRLSYDRRGRGAPVVTLHGWPSDRHDWREVAELCPGVDFITPDLRGFGDSDAHAEDPARSYTPAAQAASITGLIEELGVGPVVLAGYDLGSMVADHIARARPDLVRGLVLAPPLPGLAPRMAEPPSLRERWYIPFHQTPLVEQLIDGDADAVRATLEHFWSRWAGPAFTLAASEFERLTRDYSRPGAYVASTAIYRSGRPVTDDAPLTAPATLLWPDADPLFPALWAADVGDHFRNARLELLDGAGHFAPREAPERFAAAIQHHVSSH